VTNDELYSFKNVIASEAKQSHEIEQNPKGLLRHPSGVPRNDDFDKWFILSFLN
jgi:hypothetical protein